MNIIEMFLIGETDAKTFIVHFQNDIEVQKELSNLIPSDAINNPDHNIWKGFSYHAVAMYDFNCYRYLKARYRFDNSLGDNLNVFSVIETFYCYSHPEVIPTTYYSDAYGLFLDAVGDTYEGPEVRELVERIIKEALSITPKTKRIKTVKQQIKNIFHVEGMNYPRWIQGAEWPMGVDSPMQYISRERKGEQVCFLFRDVSTGVKRTVIQYY